jgi:SAM-dependent methyltransferase
MRDRILEELDTEGLRAAFLEYTRVAYGLIPPISKPRILDAGCGTGLPTVELARLGDGEIVAIDPDENAIDTLRQRIEKEGLSDRVRTVCCSIFETGFAAASFDIIWEEGVFHILDTQRVLAESARLVNGGGFLVMFETNEWFERTHERFADHGFDLVHRVPLPPGSWWTRYYAPLEERVAALREKYGEPEDRDVLSRFEREIESVKANVAKSDCSFVILCRKV